jgi:hypothetical protein
MSSSSSASSSNTRKRRRRAVLVNKTRDRTTTSLPTSTSIVVNEDEHVVEEPSAKRIKVNDASHLLPNDVSDQVLDSIQFGTVNLALQKLRSLCSGLPVPLMLKHMLHAMLTPNMQTQIEHELDELLKEGIIRQFQMHHLGPTVTGYCYTDDLISYIRKFINSSTTSTYSPSKLNKNNTKQLTTFEKQQQQLTLNRQVANNERTKILGEKFISDVMPQCTNTVISQQHLKQLLQCQDTDIPLLMHLGLITIKDNYDFYFNVPSAGQFITDVKKGREEVQSMLRRKKYKEIMLHTLQERTLKKSSLTIVWHMRELLGLGLAEIIETSNGKMVRLK